ncbi:uncharacterized protein HMPREF1541_00258 [Cyphellophora europaea CBS 101466]|uniref:CMP/dCMP-type deaminase domain-containing protein n=1 Tax=Cyphellophora europaea (strain CBS 101466) TaxID=1220924 RepID=W2SDU0_CYPE1|nr:uncharacterized protein HMPREF1541_00258 [Cyphellophora europaea CBS 101466]ETN46074.1 hypothetical protein HMPREF1541_00258 [Cyphellophora europaea CBS 101466]
MARAKAALGELAGTPCPFAAFGAAVVNHTAGPADDDGGELVCLGVNSVRRDGNPTLHGEVAAINNCTSILTSPDGPYKYNGQQALDALTQLSLYTTAEACPMCASAIAQANFAEYIFATSIPDLISWGWPQISIRSLEVFERSAGVQRRQVTRIVQGVLREETDPLFQWQFQARGECPRGCAREGKGVCGAVKEDGEHDEL